MLAGPEGLCYCGPAVHTLFIGSTRMAGDDDFIKSGREGGAGLWVGWAGLLKAMYRYATPPQLSFPTPTPSILQYTVFMNLDISLCV